MASERPVVPPPGALRPLVEVWPPGARILRCHSSAHGPVDLNPGVGVGRFHPFHNAAGEVVPTLYGSGDLDAALSGTVFHNVPIRGAVRAIRHASLRPMFLSVVAPSRELRLVQLHGHGLRRLGVSRDELIASEADRYAETARWAAALHACRERPDGLTWISRQHDSRALVLFGDRVERRDLQVVEEPLPLCLGPGFERVQRAAEEAGITILE